MGLISDMGSKIGIGWELMAFLWHNKMWWMTPFVAVLVLLGLVIGFGSASGVGPFIYTLF